MPLTALRPGIWDRRLAESLNRDCHCIGVDLDALRAELERDIAQRGLSQSLVQSHPHLFSAAPVFVAREHLQRMAQIIAAVESVVALPACRDHVLQWAPETARFDPGPIGVFLGYDFHIGPEGPRLIEINTNAGGAMLNAVLARAQRACCEEVETLFAEAGDVGGLESRLVTMFRAEWRKQRGAAPLTQIAIVDDAPQTQYLYPEFLLFQKLFERSGIAALIADPSRLALRDGALWAGEHRIDLVYNRLTDFALADPAHEALRRAWVDGLAVVTPHPRAHALYADKRNLAVLSDSALLDRWGVSAETATLLAQGIPHTRVVTPDAATDLWESRKRLFFKPAAGFGSRGSYRGEKLTRRVFEDILAGSYVAQEFVPPSERMLRDADAPSALKLDLRNYVYDGEVQLVAARLYQGQTTNFRTPGGGFAPVFSPAL
ncbi:MAG: hypothetical protein HYU77_00365 [Betaproteobacteria bacterium]|nr:hypothetical protein [Betaproteobacteria bacterium]